MASQRALGFTFVATAALAVALGAQSPTQPPARVPPRADTLFGGAGGERVQGLWVLHDGSVLVAGETSSDFRAMPEFPKPSPPFFDEHLNTSGGNFDAYVAVLEPDLSAVRSWTYLGGHGQDRAYFAMEEPRPPWRIWVCGFTHASQCSGGGDRFPATDCYVDGSCVDASCNGPTTECWDVFVAQLSHDLRTLHASTLLGGSRNENPRGTLWLDVEGGETFAYVSGATTSPDFHATLAPAQAPSTGACAGNAQLSDAFLAKIDESGALEWSTCLGGDASDSAWANVRVDPATHDVFLGGSIASSHASLALPAGVAVLGARQGPGDAFVAKYASDGTMLALAYVGGSGRDFTGVNDSLELDRRGRPIVAGISRSGDLPTTPYALNPTHSECFFGPCSPVDSDAQNDVFVARLSRDLSTIQYCTYLNQVPGGFFRATCREEPAGLAVRGRRVAICGETNSYFFPMTPEAFDPVISGAVAHCMTAPHDAFLTEIRVGTATPSQLLYSTFFGGDQLVTGTSETGTRGRTMSWMPADSPWAGCAIMGGQTTMGDAGLLTTEGAAFGAWIPGDVRSGFVEIHRLRY